MQMMLVMLVIHNLHLGHVGGLYMYSICQSVGVMLGMLARTLALMR
jgi:hypothetical protein